MSDNNEKRHRGTAGAAEWLLALTFFPMGLLFLALGTIPKSYEALDVHRWTAVPAELVAVNSWHEMEYRYQWQGTERTSHRFSLMGDISSYSEDEIDRALYFQLKETLESGETITAWVNPNKPYEAVIDRSVRWKKLLLAWFLPLLSCLIGYYGLHSLFQSGTAPEGYAPWLANPKWRNKVIYSGSRSSVTFWWVAALVLGVIGILPFTATSSTGTSATTSEIQLITVFPFNLLMLAAFGAAFRSTRQWWRYGASPLILDPFPGSIGGDVGGEIHFRIPYSRGIKAEVQLTATRKDDTGGSKNFRTTTVWREDGYAKVTEKEDGIALQFLFAVPEELPASDISYGRRRYAKSHFEWRLIVTVKTAKEEISRSYEIPVYPTGVSTSAITTDTLQENPFSNSHHAAHKILPVVQHQGAETTLKFPMLGITTGMLLFLWLGLGLTFVGGVIVFVGSGYSVARMQSVLYLIAGLTLLGRTLYRYFSALQVQFTGNIVISERLLLGIPLRSRYVSYFDIQEINFELAPKAKTSDSSQAEHIVYATTDKGDVILAERIEGRRKAELVCEHLSKLISTTNYS